MSGGRFVKALPRALEGRCMSLPLGALVPCAGIGARTGPLLAEDLLPSSTTILAGRDACGNDPSLGSFGAVVEHDELGRTLILMIFGL